MMLSEMQTLRNACLQNTWNADSLRLAKDAAESADVARVFWAALVRPANIQTLINARLLTPLRDDDPVVNLKLRLLLGGVKEHARTCDEMLAGFVVGDQWQANVIVDIIKECPVETFAENAYACLCNSIARNILPIDSKDFGRVVRILVEKKPETDVDQRALDAMCAGSDRRDRHYLEGFWKSSELIELRSRHAALIDILLAAFLSDRANIGNRDHVVHGLFSLSWRPVIGKDAANRDWEFNNVLLDILLDLLEVSAAEPSQKYLEALAVFGASESILFRRIHLYLVASHGSQAQKRELMLNHELFDNVLYRNEMANLFKHSFGLLSRAEQEVVLGWIDAGPVGENSQPQIDQWRRNKLSWVETQLSGPQRLRFDSLMSTRGVTSLADRASHHSIRWGDPEAVTDPVAIKGLPIGDAFALLVPEAIGNVHFRELRNEVASNPLGWTRALATAPPIQDKYVREILTAVEKAIKDRAEVAWPELLNFLTSRIAAVSRSDESRHVFSAICDVVAEGLKNALPYSFYEQIRVILGVAIQFRGEGEDKPDIVLEEHVSEALNSPEGRAASCVCQAVRWVIAGENISLAGERLEGRSERLQELTRVIDEHLRLGAVSRAYAVFAAYGLHSGLLRWIDLEWFTRLTADVLLLDDERDRGDPAWGFWCAFLRYHHAHLEWFRLFETNYRTTARFIASAGDADLSRNDAIRSYVEHVVSLAWQGHLTTDAGGLLAQVFDAAKRSLRWAGLSYMGRVLTDNEQAPPQDISDRFKTIWDWYWSQQGPADSAAHRLEKDRSHHPFGAWYASGVLGGPWSLDRLSKVLQESADLEPADDIMETLLRNFVGSERLALTCAKLLVAGDENGWKMFGWKEPLRQLLALGIAHGGDVREDALVLLKEVVLAGNVEFLDLLG